MPVRAVNVSVVQHIKVELCECKNWVFCKDLKIDVAPFCISQCKPLQRDSMGSGEWLDANSCMSCFPYGAVYKSANPFYSLKHVMSASLPDIIGEVKHPLCLSFKKNCPGRYGELGSLREPLWRYSFVKRRYHPSLIGCR